MVFMDPEWEERYYVVGGFGTILVLFNVLFKTFVRALKQKKQAVEFAMETREQELDQFCNMDYIWIVLGLVSGFRVASGA